MVNVPQKHRRTVLLFWGRGGAGGVGKKVENESTGSQRWKGGVDLPVPPHTGHQ